MVVTTTDSIPTERAASTQSDLRRLRPNDRRNLMATAARAFTHDPMFEYMAGDRLRAHRLLPGMMRGTVDDLMSSGDCWVTDDDDGQAIGFAGWLSPARMPRGSAREARIAAKSVTSALQIAHPLNGARLLGRVERHHLHKPHWYLALLVVDPDVQGRGLGTRLMQPGLELADRDGLPCYLETQKRSNVSWYGRFGFEATETIELPGVPPVWCMTRPGGA